MIRIEIEGIDDLKAFVAIITGRVMEDSELRDLTSELNKSADNLIKSENNQPKMEN